MPGLVEGHAHISFGGAVNDSDLGNIPPEEHMLLTARNAKTLLDPGFTALIKRSNVQVARLDVAMRNAAQSLESSGARMRAGSPEITVTGGLGDERKAHMYYESFGLADGKDEIRKAVRLCCEGVDNIKVNISGDDLSPARAHAASP